MSDTIQNLLIAAGGGTAAALAILAVTWKFLSGAFMQKMKHKHAQELEALKNELAGDRERLGRLEKEQFGVYQEVWDMLCDLRMSADRLWTRASERNLTEFGRHHGAVRGFVYRQQVILDEPHLGALQRMIDRFREFYDGKEGLLEARRREADDEEIRAIIANNQQLRESYTDLVNEIGLAFRRQLREGQAA